MAERLEDRFGFAGDAVAPVDQRAEHVEEAGLGCLHDGSPSTHDVSARSNVEAVSALAHIAIVRHCNPEHEEPSCHIQELSPIPSVFAGTTATPAKPITLGPLPAAVNFLAWC